MHIYSLKYQQTLNSSSNLKTLQKKWSESAIDRVTLFFAGWGMDYQPFTPLKLPSSSDLLVIYDYRGVALNNFPQSTMVKKLTEVINTFEDQRIELNLLAWSMGVMVANYLLTEIAMPMTLFSEITAINGTLLPVHNDYGIPKVIFKKTLENLKLSINARDSFNKLMCQKTSIYNQFQEHQPKRSLESIISELQDLEELTQLMDRQTSISPIYNKVIIAESDRIIPRRNQVNFWQQYPEIKTIELKNSSHFPFYSEFIDYLL